MLTKILRAPHSASDTVAMNVLIGTAKVAADRIDFLEAALNEMPSCDLEFSTKQDMLNWIVWKQKYFTSEGEIKED